MNFLLGDDGYLFQLHTGHADQNRLIETALISIPSILLVKVFYCFHYNLRFFFCFFFGGALVFLVVTAIYFSCILGTLVRIVSFDYIDLGRFYV